LARFGLISGCVASFLYEVSSPNLAKTSLPSVGTEDDRM